MNAGDSARLECLLNELVDGLLSDAGEKELAEMLRNNVSARKHYRRFMSLHAGLVWDYATAAIPAEREFIPERNGSFFRAWGLVSAVAAALVIAVGILSLARSHWLNPEKDIVDLEMAQGAISWSAGSGVRRSGLVGGEHLREGSVFVQGENGSAQLRFGDGTVITLTGESEMAFSDNGQKRLTLQKGALSAEVRKQPEGKPMLIHTNSADLQILGTTFSLTVDSARTALSVDTGTVKFIRITDGQALSVTSNQSSLATLDAKSDLQLAEKGETPTPWHRNFVAPPSPNSKGIWHASDGLTPARMQAVPYVAATKQNGTQVIHYGVSARAPAGEAGGFASLVPGSTITVRYRTQSPGHIVAFMTCHRSNGSFAGNFEAVLSPLAIPATPDGWHAGTIAVDEMIPLIPKYQTTKDTRVSLLLIHTRGADSGLEVAEMTINQPR